MEPLRSSRATTEVSGAAPCGDAGGAAAVVESGEIGAIGEIAEIGGNGAIGLHDDIEERVRLLVESQVQQRIPSNSADLFVAGAVDSLSLVEILMRLEEEFDTQIRLDELELEDFRSVAAIARLLARSGIGR